MPPVTAVSCGCGKVTAVSSPGITWSNLRCPWCPPEKPKPVLRLVT